MQVGAISKPGQPDWRWRIVNYAGEIVEESRRTFPTIALAVEHGRKRAKELDPDRSVAKPISRSTSHLRSAKAARPA
jgi:hypothetical protein